MMTFQDSADVSTKSTLAREFFTVTFSVEYITGSFYDWIGFAIYFYFQAIYFAHSTHLPRLPYSIMPSNKRIDSRT